MAIKKILTTIVALLLLTSVISAIGVTLPNPQNIELKPGEDATFKFQIQSKESNIECKIVRIEEDGLKFEFSEKYSIAANNILEVNSKVSVPKETEIRTHTAKFCVECSSLGEIEGSRTIDRTCGQKVTVDVISGERTRQNIFDSGEEKRSVGEMIFLGVLIILFIIILIMIWYLIKRMREKKEVY